MQQQIMNLLKNSWSDMWLEFGQRKYPYDENFMSVSHYVKDNSISEPFTKKLTRK